MVDTKWVRRKKRRDRVKDPCVQEESKSGMGRKPGKGEECSLPPHRGEWPIDWVR